MIALTTLGRDRAGTGDEGTTAAERAYRRALPDLRCWAGAYVFVLGDRVVGVFGDEATARHVAGQAVDPALEVLIRRVDDATPSPGEGLPGYDRHHGRPHPDHL